MTAKAISTWAGTWKHGLGTIATNSGTPASAFFSYASRFEGAPGASPEELLAAAHSGCVNQALANNFGMNGLEAESIQTSVEIEVHQSETGSPTITSSNITVVAKVPNCSTQIFEHCVERARLHCSISAILNCDITMKATLLP